MTFHYSQPFESLIEKAEDGDLLTRSRAVIIGSGYGGSVAALRLAQGAKGLATDPQRIIVLERGNEYALGDFPTGLETLPRFVSLRSASDVDDGMTQDALFDVRMGEKVDVVVGSGLGGTSLINANVAIQPDIAAFSRDPWPQYFRTAEARESLQNAFKAVRRWLDVPDKPSDAVRQLNKYRALERLAQALDLDIEPAPINVALISRTNYAGVPQNQCTNCGNCVTGCNVGAKSTLAMNLIPAAHASGAEFFTGALVYSVQPPSATTGAHWRVYVKPTSHKARARFPQRFYIEADIVILAAGTLGSTEILQRSAKLGYLELSEQLGRHFSTNGDGVAASFCEADPVNAVGSTDFLQRSKTGPTITACARPRTDGSKFLLEDGAIPAPLTELSGEIVTTAAQFGRLTYNRLPAWLAQRRQFDPLAVHRQAQEHGQVFLMMCDDGARGRLQFEGEPLESQPELGTIVPRWDVDSPALAAVTDRLAKQDREPGLNSGQFVANPAWQLLPETAGRVMDGAFPGNRLITVHPLGGCRMADSEAGGVVNHDGQVFWRGKDTVYPGLHVLDGSILPCALGANPFLTIAALAWRACDQLVHETVRLPLKKLPLAAPDTAPPAPIPDQARIVIREQLIGALPMELHDSIKQQLYALFPGSSSWFERDRLVLRIETEPASTEVALRGGGEVRVRARLYLSPIRGDEARRWKTYGISSARLGLDENGQPQDPQTLLAVGEGTMTIVEPRPPRPEEIRSSRQLAFDRYKERRSRSWLSKAFWWGLRLLPIIGDEPPGSGPLNKARAFASIAEMVSTARTFTYQLKLKTPQHGKSIRISGQKVLAWGEEKRLWSAFTQLDATFTLDGITLPPTRLYVDLDYLVDDGLLRVATGSNVPRAIFNCLAYIARLSRAALQAQFWEFGAPDYPKKDIERNYGLPRKIAGWKRRDVPLSAQTSLADETRIPLQLHRYGESGKLGPVLLLHGLAQGSLIFAHERFKKSMTQFLVESGYDVWLLDYRLSPQLHEGELPGGTWSIDDIARFDIPEAIGTVLDSYAKGTRVHVFAHCVGAAATSMAILRGWVSSLQIASFALNAIHPWIMPSPYNLVRAKVGAAFGDHIDGQYLDPIIQREGRVDATQTLLDRVGFSVARYPEREGKEHDFGHPEITDAICDRMTFMYGRMWRHANVKRIHGAWQDLVGKAPPTVYRHLLYMLGRERVVDCEGRDRYIDPTQLQNWKGIRTLFMHGEESEVFNPQSATRSAIRLSQALRSTTPIRLRRIVNFGHMDPILAETAPRESYRYLDYFFQGCFDYSDHYKTRDDEQLAMDRIDPSDDPDAASRAKRHCGPVLRGIRLVDNKYVLRYWLELPTGLVSAVEPEQYLPAGFSKAVEVPRPPSVPPHFVWLDAEYAADKLPPAAAATAERLGKRTAGNLDDCHFIVASCCYPGTPFDRESTDEAYTGINALLDNPDKASDALFLIGDQIYADSTAGLLDPYSWRDRYEERYWTAFNAPRAQRALVRIPTHFAIDDHEIANDFCGIDPQAPLQVQPDPNARRFAQMQSGRIESQQLQFARLAALQYMGSPWQGPPAPARKPQDLWYALDTEDLACPAFVMDTRSERQRQGSQAARMMDPRQLEALKTWLARVGSVTRPKFIFMGSVIAPLTQYAHAAGKWMSEDGWVAYRAQLDEIVAYIVAQQIQDVVFVAGDLHLSCVARLTLRDQRGIEQPVAALQIVSSGLYAPLSFANTAMEDIDWGQKAVIPLGSCAIDYSPESFGEQRPRFLRVSIAPRKVAPGCKVAVAPYDVQGRLCGRIITTDDASAPVEFA
jgi:cholesterol oxidase